LTPQSVCDSLETAHKDYVVKIFKRWTHHGREMESHLRDKIYDDASLPALLSDSRSYDDASLPALLSDSRSPSQEGGLVVVRPYLYGLLGDQPGLHRMIAMKIGSPSPIYRWQCTRTV
jgi:hypothetical protein